MSPEPDAKLNNTKWPGTDDDGKMRIKETTSVNVYSDLDDGEPLFTADTIQEEIDIQIKYHESLRDTYCEEFQISDDVSDKDAAEKHSEIEAWLRELKHQFSESNLNKNGDNTD